MNVDEFVSQAAALPREQRKDLIGRLLAMGRGERDAEFRRMLAEKVDDTSPENWVSLEDLPKHLELGGEGE
ncbi:MAG TPA: hypothetical protein VGM54_17585 [Chthoniobacter sp.]